MKRERPECLVVWLTTLERKRVKELARITGHDEGTIVRKVLMAAYRAAKREQREYEEDDDVDSN
jgi:hypothetical protein